MKKLFEIVLRSQFISHVIEIVERSAGTFEANTAAGQVGEKILVKVCFVRSETFLSAKINSCFPDKYNKKILKSNKNYDIYAIYLIIIRLIITP